MTSPPRSFIAFPIENAPGGPSVSIVFGIISKKPVEIMIFPFPIFSRIISEASLI